MSDQPKISFDGTVMRVGAADYQIENVRKWMVGDADEIAVNVQTLTKGNETISFENGVLSVGNLTDVRAYNMAGVEMPVQLKNGQVDMSAWPRAIYVIKIGNETIKISKK